MTLHPHHSSPLNLPALRSLAAASSTALVVSVIITPGLGVALWKLTPPVQAHANRCITIRKTALTDVDTAVSKLDPHLHCLHIEDNSSLEKLAFNNLPNLVHLSIKNNNNLKEINLTTMTNLTHLRIDSNNELTKVKLPKSDSLRRLHIANNDKLENLENLKEEGATEETALESLINLTCLVIEDNHSLIAVNLPELQSLTCLKISNNKCLEEIRLPKLINATQIHIANNERLEMINIPRLIDFAKLKIENNEVLGAFP